MVGKNCRMSELAALFLELELVMTMGRTTEDPKALETCKNKHPTRANERALGINNAVQRGGASTADLCGRHRRESIGSDDVTRNIYGLL